MVLSAPKIPKLESRALVIRQDIISMLVEAGSGHSAGSLDMVDVLVALYFQILNHDPKRPDWEQRDRLVLSNGHICPALYAVLAHAGYFSASELKNLRKLGSRLQGHPHRQSLPGLETTSGPLGCGLSQACGMAMAARMDQVKWRIICLMSDGEQDEGNTWEAVLFAGKNRLSNLTALIDRNNIQIDGFTEDVMPLEPLKEKYEAFGWHVLEIDGHNFEAIIKAFDVAKTIVDQPTIIIAHTIPGKGVDFMEFDYRWHGEAPNRKEARRALKELRSLQGKIRSGHND